MTAERLGLEPNGSLPCKALVTISNIVFRRVSGAKGLPDPRSESGMFRAEVRPDPHLPA